MEDYKGQVIVSNEKDFLFRRAMNRGFVQVPRMIVNCRKLSVTAKVVYSAISSYVYEQGRSAFPSTSRLAMNANVSQKTVIKHVDELVEKGFIHKERFGNRKTNNYHLIDADKVAHLRVSEMFHSALRKAMDVVPSFLYDSLFERLLEIEDGLSNEEFRNLVVSTKAEEELVMQLLSKFEQEGEIMFKPPNSKNKVPEVGETNKPLGGTLKKAGSTPPVRSTTQLPEDVDKWKPSNFLSYFIPSLKKLRGADTKRLQASTGG